MKGKIIYFVFVVLLFLLVFLVLVCRAMVNGISHDEYQFVAGGQLFETAWLLPYIDYPYLHMPYMPVINGVVARLSSYDFLVVRLFGALCGFFSAILVFYVAARAFRQTSRFVQALIGVLAVLLLITNPSLWIMDGRALNHALPVLLSIIIVVIYWRAGETGFRRTDFLICGLLAGLAAGIRLSYAALVVPIIFAILLDPLFLTRTERLKHMLAFAIGLLLSLLPVGILFLMAPRQFIYGNFHYIALNTVYRKNLNFAIDMTLWNKLDYFGRHMYESPEVLLLYLAFIGFVAAGLVRWLRSRDRAVFWLILLQVFTSVFLLSAFTPTPLWLQYFFAPVPFLILGSLYGLSVFFGHLQTLIFKIALAVFILVLLVLHTPRLSEDFNKLARTDQWVPLQIHQYGSAIRAQLRCPEVCKVLTLSPVLPMEAGLQTYPMFAVGSFSWRTAPLLAKDRRDGYRIISYHDLDTFLSLDPPDAILTGTEADYDSFSRDFRDSIDQPFVDYAVRNNYQPVPLPEIFDDMGLEIILWVSASAQR